MTLTQDQLVACYLQTEARLAATPWWRFVRRSELRHMKAHYKRGLDLVKVGDEAVSQLSWLADS